MSNSDKIFIFFNLTAHVARYNAISLDENTILFIQNLALADLLYILVSVVPPATSYLVGRYVLGDILCFVGAHFSFIPASASTLTILLLTLHKLRSVLFPFSSPTLTLTKTLVVLTWAISSALTIISLAYKSKPVFNQVTGKCLASVYTNKAASLALKTAVIVIFILPVFLITLCNVILLTVATRQLRRTTHAGTADRTNFKPIITVGSLSGILIISWVPFIIFTFLKDAQDEVSQFTELTPNFIYLNCFLNPILYTITNARFRRYVVGVLKRL